MDAPAGRLRHRVGRRGTALLAFAALDIAMALRLVTASPDDGPLYAWLHDPAPLWPWALVWMFVAVCCLAGARRARDKVAFTAAIGVKVLWCGLHVTGWTLGAVEDGWISSVVWGTVAVIVWLIAGWPEPVNGEGRPAWTPPLE